ncbi:hypothetical protein Sros01_28910 [Streptomyces roseochromogenus]|nr:hypothetical protein Sros01_28910 [Streptomyces roseochromogenus]
MPPPPTTTAPRCDATASPPRTAPSRLWAGSSGARAADATPAPWPEAKALVPKPTATTRYRDYVRNDLYEG